MATTYTDCITFTGETSDFTLAVDSHGAKEWDGTVEYSTDHNTWAVWDGSEISSVDKKLYLRGIGNTKFYTKKGARLSLSARTACSGNIQTLLEYSNPPASIPADSCYRFMFYNCQRLTQAPELPATTLTEYCYYSMFENCNGLTQAPALPATSLVEGCYYYMFRSCTSLTQAPTLPVTELNSYCYSHMFENCTGLTQAPELPATTLANNCYSSMFWGCTGLIQAPTLPAIALATRCYESMFSGCRSLTAAPELPATTLKSYCYYGMFQNCTNLTQAPELPATTLADYCYQNMFYGCTGLTQAPALPVTTLTDSCYYGMFQNCTNLTQAPELPATTLMNSCYRNMFYGCTNLTSAPELPATTLAIYCYYSMFYNCTSLAVPPELPATTLANNCYYYMFYGCTSLTQAPKLPATTLADSCYADMFYGCTSLKISATKSSEYPATWRIPSSGTISSTATGWNTSMLSGTGGTFTSDPSENTTYYGAWTVVETYNISYNLTNCTGASTNPTTIDGGTTATLSFTANDGYSFPDTITVAGAESYTWDKSTGTLTLTNATSDVSITITCIVAYPKINSFTYYGKQINNINGKPIRYVHHSGNTYEMVYIDPNANYLRDEGGYVLQDSDGNYLEFTEALATPQNVTANGTTVSWDDVENATSYAVLADGVSIGTVEGAATNLISFTIAGTSYQAEEGMTWGQWVESSYNTGGFYIIAGNTRVIFSNGTDYVSSEGFPGDYANNTSQIVSNGTYYKFSSGGGAN